MSDKKHAHDTPKRVPTAKHADTPENPASFATAQRSSEPFHSSAPPPEPPPAFRPAPPESPEDFHVRLHAVEVELSELRNEVASLQSVPPVVAPVAIDPNVPVFPDDVT